MKKKLIAPFRRMPMVFFYLVSTGWFITVLQGCGCETYCLFTGKNAVSNLCKIEGISESSLLQFSDPVPGIDEPSWIWNCQNICKALVEKNPRYMKVLDSLIDITKRRTQANSQSVTQKEPSSDTVVVVGNPIPQKEAPGQIEGPPKKEKNYSYIFPDEYFVTTVFAGPTTSFMSANGGSDYGSITHPPGIGLQFGVGTALPIKGNWGFSTSIRFKQTNGAEKLDYSYPGGGGGSGSRDTYTYNYIGGTIMAQRFLNRHLSITAGPELNYLLSASMKSGSNGDKEKIKNSSTSVGVDMLAGFKYEIPAGNRRSKWGLSLIYDHRLSRLNKKEDNGLHTPAYHMKSVQLGVSYFICNCGKK